MKIYSAPLQGYTECVWRNLHYKMFGGIENYYTPFLRIDKGEIRKKYLNDINPSLNEAPIIPQIIATKSADVEIMLQKIISLGYKQVDVNLGCPFPLITGKHQGAGMLPYPEEIKQLFDTLSNYKENISFSVKVRLGNKDNTDLQKVLPLIEDFAPEHLTVHPRFAKQQYKGDIDMDVFSQIYNSCSIPLIYNGDITTIEDIKRIENQFPKLKGIMIGRGLLMNPALAREYNNGEPLNKKEYVNLISGVFNDINSTLQGDTQILSKIKPYWEYAHDIINPKILKAIKKSNTVDKYMNAVSAI